MGDQSVTFCAEATHDDEVLWAFERAVFEPVFDDAVGQAGANARQCFKLRGSGSIEIDRGWLRGCLSCCENTSQHYA